MRSQHPIVKAAILSAGLLTGGTSNPAGAHAAPAHPAGVACYIEAVNAAVLERLVGCFARDAVIIDVSRRIRGSDAIQRWANAEVIGGRLELLSFRLQEDGRVRCLVHWAPRGSSGWRAWYTFTRENGRITVAELQYA